MKNLAGFFLTLLLVLAGHGQGIWQADLDSDIRFYQTTDLGILLAGTERSLYAIDGQTGQRLWRLSTGRINETAVTPVPDTDLILVARDLGSKSRLEAIDVISGGRLWQSDKVKGDVLQLAADPSTDLLAVVLVKDPRGRAGEEFKRKPIVHALRLSSGDELWKRELDSDIEMMPARFGEDLGEVAYTLDNYRAPLLLDERLFLFYEGATSYDARTGKEKEREKFRINEEGRALTEADPVFDERRIYISGRGRIRAVNRRTGNVEWKADDLGTAAEMALLGRTLFVRTGGQFTRLKDGDVESKGPFGVSAINTENGEVLWRYKGADKGITNLLVPDRNTIAIADRDDLIFIDATNGKRTARYPHKIDRASFGLLNERGDVVIGGQSEIAAFDPVSGRQLWRARHTSPGRGVFRTVAAIAARAASLYFRYGGTAMTAVRGVQIARTVTSLSWSGLASRSSFTNLQSLATASGSRRKPTVSERVLDRVDPSRQLDRLSRFLWHRERLATRRGNWMYFYTDLKNRDGNVLVGVNVNNGRSEREVRLSDLDERFVTDEVFGLLFVASGNRLIGFNLLKS